jgi:tetratricopeptide (TPR) repeat protein
MRANFSVTNRWIVLAILFVGIAPAQDSLSEAATRNNAAVLLVDEGRYAEAEEVFRAALGAKYDDDLTRAKIANNLASLYQRLDRYRDAEQMFRRALQWRQKNLPSTSLEVAYSFNNLAEIYRILGRDWDARNLLETAARTLQQFHPEAHGLGIVLSNLAAVRCRFREFDAAEELLRVALISSEKQQGAGSREYGVALNNLGQVLETRNEFEAAVPVYAQAIGIFEHLGSEATLDLAAALANSGELYQHLDRMAEAQEAEKRALSLLHQQGDAPLRAAILRNIGNIVAVAGQPADSLPYFEQSLTIQERTLGREHPATASILFDYAAATLRAGQKSLSRKLRKRAVELLSRQNIESPDQLTVSVRDLRDAK